MRWTNRIQAWQLDKSGGGNGSLYGDNWGCPPERVGRDPRYAKVLHEGNETYFESSIKCM